jgi:hypothetical protein
MEREKRVLPLTDLEVTVDGLLPKASVAAKTVYILMMLLLLLLFAAILI